MCRNNHQYKVGENILVKQKKHELYFMSTFLVTQINDNGTDCYQKVIVNDATNIFRIRPSFD